MTLNDKDSLYFEASTGKNADTCIGPSIDMSDTFPRDFNRNSTSNYPSYATSIDYQMAIGMGASFETNYLFGLPERESTFELKSTLLENREPYNFFNIDYYGHHYPDARGEYGSMPYVTGHSVTNDASLMWMNAADTWADLITIADNKKITNFVSESGQLELFIFSSNHPKIQLANVAKITGHGTLPPIETLGYHFSKYADVSADIMTERD